MHPRGREVTEKVLRGELGVGEAAEILGVTRDQMSWHLRHHVGEAAGDPDPEDILVRLRDRLWEIVEDHLATGDVNPQLVRELRSLVKDLRELGGSGAVDCGEALAEWLTRFTGWAMENLPRDVAEKIARYVEENPA
jgi:hypothetical protein